MLETTNVQQQTQYVRNGMGHWACVCLNKNRDRGKTSTTTTPQGSPIRDGRIRRCRTSDDDSSDRHWATPKHGSSASAIPDVVMTDRMPIPSNGHH